MTALIRYHFKTYFKSSKFIMPLAIYIIFMVMMCGGAIEDVTSILVVSMVATYFLMVWSSFVFTDCEELVAEQIAILKSKNMKKFYLSKNIFIVCWSIIYAVMGMIVPILGKIISLIFHTAEYHNFTIGNLLIAFLLHICLGMLGAAVGFIWHPRIMANRKIAAIGAFSYGVMGIISGPLGEDFVVVKFLKYVFPPVYPTLESLGMGERAFSFGDAIIPMVVCVVYAVVLIVINVVVLHKKGF
ncbi:MAG: hypothetical protein E7262_08015 [Lachnospiraceae bacterium]|nr:hypothetical protein [Lachnospiraceae bacterium]